MPIPPSSTFQPASHAFSALPPKVARIAQAYFASIVDELRPRFDRLLTELERRLIELIDNARHQGSQPERIADLHALRRRNAELTPAVLARLEAQLAGLRGSIPASAAGTGRRSLDYQLLSLVEDAQIDQQIVIDEIIRRHEGRCSMALLMLGQRCGVLAGSPAFEPSRIPAGPQSLCHALREAMPVLQLSNPAQLLLWHVFERDVLTDYPRLLNSINLMLEAEGVLPGLGFIPRRARGAPTSPRPIAARPRTEDRGPSMPSTWTSADTNVPHAQVSDADLLAALQTVQAREPDAARLRDPQALRQAVLQRLQAKYGPRPELAATASEAFARLERVYAVLARVLRPDSSTATLLARLQPPLAQAALRDRRFFTQPQHPARGLLEAVAESAAPWQTEADQDPQLLTVLQHAIDQVAQHYRGEEHVFEQANHLVQRHRQASAHEAELSERRQIEAARGRQQLQAARTRASTVIADALRGRSLPPAWRVLLDQTWTDLLTLVQLRQGEDSQAWTELQAITAQIADVANAPAAASQDRQLLDRIGKALLQAGYPQDEVWDIEQRFKNATRSPPLFTVPWPEIGASAGTTPISPRPPAELACLAQLRTLPHGTWFEILPDPPQSGPMRRRLSWYGTEDDSAVLVNSRGQRSGVQSLDGLARLMALGRARALVEDTNNPFDRAWRAALGNLSDFDSDIAP